jgi:hypothetical protein
MCNQYSETRADASLKNRKSLPENMLIVALLYSHLIHCSFLLIHLNQIISMNQYMVLFLLVTSFVHKYHCH